MKTHVALVAALLLAGPAYSAEKAAAKAAKKAAPANLQPNPKKLAPPLGVAVPPTVKAELSAAAEALGKEIETLRGALKDKPQLLELLPDVQIYYNAARYAVDDDIFFSTNQFASARNLLKQGHERAQALLQGQAPWATATGLVVRGYVSKLDGSVQPYGLVVPADYQPGEKKYRLDFWLHGRGDTLSEIAFIEGRQKSVGEFAPESTFVLHPYGRFMNAFKFAGEVDVFEGLAHAAKHYGIDLNKVSMRGFSMGGAGTWHLGAHHADQWAAINPGAGFVDVKNYQGLAAKLDAIPWWEQKLWNLYDPLACPINLVNSTLVAYSGEIDEQKKAADLMEKALLEDGVKMTHIIGPQTGHKYEPEAKKVVAKLVDDAANKGRQAAPKKVTLVTYSLKWNQMHWVVIDAMEQHWERARVDAQLSAKGVEVKTANVAALTLKLLAFGQPGSELAEVVIDGQEVSVAKAVNSRDGLQFQKTGKGWALAKKGPEGALAKRHDLQGPIDDAFMESFIFVRPTGQPLNAEAGKWVKTEMDEAIFQWRRQFRGAPRVMDDTAVTAADIAGNNLILWGDPKSNKLIGRMAGKLPLKWDARTVQLAGKSADATKGAPVLIYPNPLSAKHYVVLNSGFTFPQAGAGSNSQQTPKLPDWALLDMSVPVAERVSGKGVLEAGFFGEKWEVKTASR